MPVRSRLPAGEVGVVRQVVDQLADHETVVELGHQGAQPAPAWPCPWRARSDGDQRWITVPSGHARSALTWHRPGQDGSANDKARPLRSRFASLC